MSDKQDSAISRREFARRAALVSAAASIAPTNLLGNEVPARPPLPQQPANGPNPAPEGQAEIESRFQTIISQYGGRFSEAQKTDLRRLATEAQPPLDRLRAYATENGDGPALYLKPLIEHEKKHAAAPAAQKPANTAKKS